MDIMREVALLMINKANTSYAAEIVAVFAEMLGATSTCTAKQLNHKCNFLVTAAMEQEKHTQQLQRPPNKLYTV